jgi:DNA-binding transcriptional regulator YdaS (Cro superfamily)
MKLADYLQHHSIHPADFAKSIGVSRETVRRYMVGIRRPNRKKLPKIAEATNGQVTANDFFGIAA